MICYVGTEQGIANWISKFLETYHHYDPQTKGADTVAYFWGLMTAGGVVGLVLLKIMDSRKVLIGFTVAALVCLTAALFGSGPVALIAFPAVGFFASVMYPIIFSLALNSVDEHHGSFAGIMVTGHYRRGDRSADHRRPGGCAGAADGDVLPVCYAGLYLEDRILGEAADHESNGL